MNITAPFREARVIPRILSQFSFRTSLGDDDLWRDIQMPFYSEVEKSNRH